MNPAPARASSPFWSVTVTCSRRVIVREHARNSQLALVRTCCFPGASARVLLPHRRPVHRPLHTELFARSALRRHRAGRKMNTAGSGRRVRGLAPPPARAGAPGLIARGGGAQGLDELLDHAGVFDRGEHHVFVAVGDLAHGLAQDLPERVLGRASTTVTCAQVRRRRARGDPGQGPGRPGAARHWRRGGLQTDATLA